MKKQPLVSVIVPAYNASKTLNRALDSVLIQHVEDIEIIVIENGSTDNTMDIAQQYAVQYNNVIVSQSSKGVSHARNKGLQLAKGKYVTFLDADDYFLEHAIRTFCQVANEDISVILFGHQKHGNVNHLVTDRDYYCSKDEVRQRVIDMMSNPTKYLQTWAKLIKKDIIDDARFNTNLRYAEDSDFMIEVLLRAKNIAFKSQVIYHYATDEPSTVRQFSEDIVDGYEHAMVETREKLKKIDWSEDLRHAFYQYVCIHLNIAMVRGVFPTANDVSISEKTKKMVAVSQKNVFHEAIQNVTISDVKQPHLLPAFLLKRKWYTFAKWLFMLRVQHNEKKEG